MPNQDDSITILAETRTIVKYLEKGFNRIEGKLDDQLSKCETHRDIINVRLRDLEQSESANKVRFGAIAGGVACLVSVITIGIRTIISKLLSGE